MKRADDPYRLGWRFWSRYLLHSAVAAAGMSALAYLLKEPVSWTQFVALSAVMFLGPALSAHYHQPQEQMKRREP